MGKVQFSEPLRFLIKLGFSPYQTENSSCIKRIFCVVIFLCVVISSCLELSTNFNKATIIRGCELLSPYYQVACRFFVLIKHKNKLKVLLEESAHFWELDEFGDPHDNTNTKIHKLLEKSFQMYRRLLYFSAVQYILGAIFNEQPMTLSYGETQGLNFKFRILYFVFHLVYLFVILTVVCGYDGVFFYIIAHILSELKMVKAAFGNSPIRTQWNSEERFRKATEHHRFLLKFTESVDRVYSLMLMHQQFSFTFGLCFASYLLIENGMPPDFEHLVKYLPYIILYFLQVWMYCFIGDLISSWSLEISDEVFYQHWLFNTSQSKLGTIIVMQRSQRPACLTLAGFRNLDLNNFTVVCIKMPFLLFSGS
ncbi:hypothetical protein Zmor_023118 [Zophobas morio]|uniref:Odorant receptor n=1 Tax=Zophobas morio TaxID=2755281 RepID=A0AA38HYP0_9CUCU|nr:hypothetical protein Zmor_023118 [Zophobas morio]